MTEVFENFIRKIYEKYKLHPANVLPISSTAMPSNLLQFDDEIDIIRDTKSLIDFEDNFRGGHVSVVGAKTTSNNEYLSNHEKDEIDKTNVFS